MELMFIWKVIIIFLPVVNKPRKGTQKYYFRPEIAVRLEVVYIKSFDFDILLGQSEFRWSRPRRKHCRQWRVKGKMSSCHLASIKPIPCQAAYRAYKKLPAAEKECVPGFNFTSDQLFWVSFSLRDRIALHFSWVTLLTGARWPLGMSAMKICLTALLW